MYKIMLRQAPSSRLETEMWAVLVNPDETEWSTEAVEELDAKLQEMLLNTPKNDIKVIQEVDWELLIKHPEAPAAPTEPPTEPVEPGGEA